VSPAASTGAAASASASTASQASASASITAPLASASGTSAASAQASANTSAAPPADTFTCTELAGNVTTAEWYVEGFEDKVDNGRWQLRAVHPAYVENWAAANDALWALTPTSPCTTNSNNPDRVVFNVFVDPSGNLKDTQSLHIALLTAINNFRTKYSNLKRISILTMTRAPNNMPCVADQRLSIVEAYVDDAVDQLQALSSIRVEVLPPFYAPNCTVYQDGGPHITETARPTIAALYGDYFSAE